RTHYMRGRRSSLTRRSMSDDGTHPGSRGTSPCVVVPASREREAGPHLPGGCMTRTLLPRPVPRVSYRCIGLIMLAAGASACDRPTVTEPDASLHTISHITVPVPANIADCSSSPL